MIYIIDRFPGRIIICLHCGRPDGKEAMSTMLLEQSTAEETIDWTDRNTRLRLVALLRKRACCKGRGVRELTWNRLHDIVSCFASSMGANNSIHPCDWACESVAEVWNTPTRDTRGVHSASHLFLYCLNKALHELCEERGVEPSELCIAAS